MKRFFYVTLLLCITILSSGCAKKINSSATNAQVLPDIAPHQKVILSESDIIALSDLPIPLGFDLIAHEQIHAVTYLCYQGKLSTEKLTAFLETDTERNGWIFESFTSPKLEAYYLTKPTRKAIITVEQKISKTLMRINLKTHGSQ